MKLVIEVYNKNKYSADGRLYKPKLFSHFGDSELMHYTLGMELGEVIKIIQFTTFDGELDMSLTQVIILSKGTVKKIIK